MFGKIGIGHGSNAQTEKGGKFNLHLSQLHPEYNYDFTHKETNLKRCMRAQYTYSWNRLALRVLVGTRMTFS